MSDPCVTPIPEIKEVSGLFQSLIRQDTPQLTSHAVMIWSSAALIIVACGIGGAIAVRIGLSGNVGNGSCWCLGTVIAWKYGYHVRYGRPFVVQKRNPHDLLLDLKFEIEAMIAQRKFIETLLSIKLIGDTPADDLRIIVHGLLDAIPELPRWFRVHVDTWVYDLKAMGA